MSVKCSYIINLMESYAAPALAEDWDNIGLIVGSKESIIKNVLVALDVNDEVIEEAIANNCNMIITHHPIIFKPINCINTSSVLGKRLIKLIKNDINLYTAHTNLDTAKGGTNDTFANLLNLKNIENLSTPKYGQDFSLGRVGLLQEKIDFGSLINKVKQIVNLKHLSICGDLSKTIQKIAICTGSAGEVSFMTQAIKQNCDAYITSDLKFHAAQFAKDNNLCLIDATHYGSENLIIEPICNYLKKHLTINCLKSNINGQTLKIV